jgi:hypothetical protein
VSIFKRRPTRLGRQVALGELKDAMGRVQENRSKGEAVPFADQCSRVCTEQGRKAHLLPPAHQAVLCKWPDAFFDADPSLPLCRLCEIEAQAADKARAS